VAVESLISLTNKARAEAMIAEAVAGKVGMAVLGSWEKNLLDLLLHVVKPPKKKTFGMAFYDLYLQFFHMYVNIGG
jgi:hypothetical protein